MRGLGKSRRKLGPARKLLEKMAVGKGGTAPVAAPLPRVVRERQERKAGYEKSAEELSRWQGLVKVGCRADQSLSVTHFVNSLMTCLPTTLPLCRLALTIRVLQWPGLFWVPRIRSP